MKINKEIVAIHKRLNDVKGTERKMIFFDSKHLTSNEISKKEIEYKVKEFISLNWVYEEYFLPIKSKDEISFTKFKHLCFGMKTSELREMENGWKDILNKSIDKPTYLYFAYYIGSNGEIIISEVGKVKPKTFEGL